VTSAERRAALEAIATEVRACTGCRLAAGRSQAVPGEGSPDTEVVFIGEGPGFNEDRLGRPFVGRAGDLLGRFLKAIDWRREDVFVTNVVKCRPPDNRDPEPDEVAACAPFLRRQLEVLDPAVIVTLGRHSMARFMPGARISQAHGTTGAVDPASGAPDATVFALFHPAAALRSTEVERQSFADIDRLPSVLLEARARRAARADGRQRAAGAQPPEPRSADPAPAGDLSIF
jgi:DNA polymerase